MRAIYHDALICDFAQYYHLYDLDQVDVRLAAVLACGLPPESRIVRKLSGQKFSTELILQMGVLDAIRSLEHVYIRAHSKKKIPKPQSVFKLLTGKQEESDIRAFKSGADFDKERERIIRGAKNGR